MAKSSADPSRRSTTIASQCAGSFAREARIAILNELANRLAQFHDESRATGSIDVSGIERYAHVMIDRGREVSARE